jgi:iron complex transport system substrate-binding protein
VKIVSLLPSATEIVFVLGLGDALEGVTFECDYPAEARAKPVISGTALPVGEHLSARQIDDEVRAKVARGEAIYTLDSARVAAIQPDLILAQDLCRVCAVPSGAVEEALAVLGCRAEVLSLDPATLDDVIGCIGAVGDVTGAVQRARTLMDQLRRRLDQVRQAVAGLERPRVLALEWSDPPYTGGHWVPDMIDVAGGEPVLAASGSPSRAVGWAEVAAAAPEIAVFMPCGYALHEAVAEGERLLEVRELRSVERVYAVDASAFFSRPGPRLVDGVEALASALHPGAVPSRGDEVIRALRSPRPRV